MAIGSFDFDSPRSQKARISASLTPLMIRLVSVSVGLLIILGVALVTLQVPAGWALIGFAAIPAMVVQWKKGELDNLAIDLHTSTIDSVMSADILGIISKSPTPYEIATLVGRVYGGYFFGSRFGIGSGFLQQISSNDKNDTEALWKEALEIKNQVGSDYVTAAVLVAALIKIHPNHQNLLAHLQLSIDDVIAGVEWNKSIHDSVAKDSLKRKTGGIARDWSFGWIPNLSHFGQNISQQIPDSGTYAVDTVSSKEVVSSLVKSLGNRGKRSVALIGPDGVGKTTSIYRLAEILLDAKSDIPEELRFNQVFMLDASSLVSAAPGRGELEGLISDLLDEAYLAKNIILCFENAELFFKDGIGSADLSNLLMPMIEAGSLPIIFTMDEQRYLQITKSNSRMAAISRVNIKSPSKEETFDVLQDQVMFMEYRKKVTYMYQAIREAYRLSDRYLHDIAMPGRAIQLLESAADYAEDSIVTAHSVQQAIEKTSDVKVSLASSDEERDKLLNLEDLIHQRMVNQTRAVSVVSDALRRARAGVRNQDRPIGTFMFLGPTGVGKTELAKALADVYFGGEDRIIRLDMNEYVSSSDVNRLIADGTKDSMSLTARVMKKPFSVVLLDEIEKAHPNVLTTLLQMLDEGILRDERNREISFKDAIIIATSNAGADRIREHIARGVDIEKYEDQFIDELIDSNQFKAEFLNRFDEIVLFRPLNKSELLQVVDLIIASVNKTLALQKVSVTVSREAKEYLVDAGYDPRLGARPMRRVVQRAVENIVAKGVLSGEVEAGGVVEIGLDQVEALISTKNQADEIAEREN